MKLKTTIAAFLTLTTCCVLASFASAQVTLVANGKSIFTIVIPAKASTSVQDAATEFQKDVKIATGAELQLQKDSVKGINAVISLGNTAQAKAAGISSKGMKDDTYHIVTKNGNLYILGIDTPDGGWTKNNGVSAGTADGVYTFLEDYLGVRWLMPGELGRVVPSKSTFTIDEIDRTYTPLFGLRHVGHLHDYSNHEQYNAIDDWRIHQRVGSKMSPTKSSYGHNWWRAVNRTAGNNSFQSNTPAVKKLYEKHPDWFAMNADGKRPLPKTHYAKFETTNPGLVRWFAEQTIKTLKDSDRPETFSLSPSDGGGRWSKSPESKALYDPNPSTIFDPEVDAGDPSMSSLVLKWYHDVAKIVAKEYPQGRLAGFIYSSYVYPPIKFPMKLPDNFTPVICGIGTYGYGLYRPENQKRWKYVLDAWAKVAPKDWYYYDLPNQLLRQYEPEVGEGNFPGTTGIITPSAPDILNTIFPTLVKDHISGTILYGQTSWSNAAMANYMLAKLSWNPKLDAYDIQRDWLQHAYGTDAAKVMEQFYTELNGWFRDYYQQHSDVSYKLTHDMLQDIYAAHYPEMQKLLLQAKSQKMTSPQKQRLQLIEDNMIVLQWRLRNMGLLDTGFKSPLQRTNAQVISIITKPNKGFSLFPGAVSDRVVNGNRPSFPTKVQFAKDAPATSSKSTFTKLGDSRFLIYAAKDDEIKIMPKMVTQGAYFAGYRIRDAAGHIMSDGILNAGTPITFTAKAGEAYYLNIPLRKPVNYQLVVQNAKVAEGSFENKTLTLSGSSAPVYVYSPLREAPLGTFESDNGVVIQKPFSGMAAKMRMLRSGAYKDVKVIASLDEEWHFSPDPKDIGLQRGVEKPDFDDSSWKTISALNWWQFQGFPDYHGVAWYRKAFTVEAIPKDRSARLFFGAIDGNAVVYLNGKKLTEHKLGKAYKGWNKPFSAYVKYKVKPGKNTLAIKVTSKPVGSSGIFKGMSLLTATRVKK